MLRRFTKKRVAVLATAIAAFAVVGGAFAFFTASGSGTGSATVGGAVNQIVVQGTTSSALTPGNSQTVSFHAWNYANQGQAISNISLSNVSACSVAWSTISYTSYGSATTPPTCADTDPTLIAADTACAGEGHDTSASSTSDGFSMLDVSVSPTGDGHLAANASNVSLTEPGSIKMNDLNSSQDACKSKFLLLSFSTT